MDAIQKLKQVLSERGIPFEEGPSSLTVKAKNPAGFDATLLEGEEATVFFGVWHEHFEDPDEAVRCFLAGLSAECRIRVTERGGKPHKWVLERSKDGKWISCGTTALMFFQYWRIPTIRYLQNGI